MEMKGKQWAQESRVQRRGFQTGDVHLGIVSIWMIPKTTLINEKRSASATQKSKQL